MQKEKRVRPIDDLKQLQNLQATIFDEFKIEIPFLSLVGFEVQELEKLLEILRDNKKQGIQIDLQSIVSEVLKNELSD